MNNFLVALGKLRTKEYVEQNSLKTSQTNTLAVQGVLDQRTARYMNLSVAFSCQPDNLNNSKIRSYFEP